MSGAHPSEALADALVEALAGAGVAHVVYCPGSRSAPLAYALERASRRGLLRAHVRLDERGAAFLAVGLCRSGGAGPVPLVDEGGAASREGTGGTRGPGPADVRGAGTAMRTAAGLAPVAVVTTSGGAVAELHAGVAEASHSRLPLVVVSADRPFELRGVGASQATSQPGIFADHVRGWWDVPAGTEPDQRLAGLVGRAVATACGLPSGEPGPVQLNVGFRDPLAPESWPPRVTSPSAGRAPGAMPVRVDPATSGAGSGAGSATGSGLEGGGVPAVRDAELHVARVLPTRVVPVAWEDVVEGGLPTVVVAGDGADPGAREWARAADVPLLAEPTSGLTASPAWVPHQQSLLSGPLAREVRQVVVTGRPTLSRPVTELLGRGDVRVVVQSPWPTWVDTAGRAAVVVPALAPSGGQGNPATRGRPPVAGGTRHGTAAGSPRWDMQGTTHGDMHEDTGAVTGAWTGRWRAASAEVTRLVDRLSELPVQGPTTWVAAADAVWRAGDRILVLGASTTVRAIDLVASVPARTRVVSNRGLAGIDGTIATAIGVAVGTGAPVRAVVGDLTFLHDSSSLMAPSWEDGLAGVDLQVVVLDDGGGSIFAGLEHGEARLADVHERWFATPQRSSVVGLARAHGVPARTVRTHGELLDALARPAGGIEVVRAPLEPAPGLLGMVRDGGRGRGGV